MHFAAQFRAATGLRPHQYLLRRRIERAQQLLIETGMPIVDVALSVGFQPSPLHVRIQPVCRGTARRMAPVTD